MTYLTSLIGRLRNIFGMGGISTTAPTASDPTPAVEPTAPSSAPETVGPTVESGLPGSSG